MTHSAAILGAGIGGLALARYLSRAGWHVDIFERSAHLPSTGTALGMWPHALRALDAIGVSNRVRDLGSPQHRAMILRPDGSVIGTIDNRNRRAYLISRPVLLAVLAEQLPEDMIAFDTTAPGLGALTDYTVVIGAEAIRSPEPNVTFVQSD